MRMRDVIMLSLGFVGRLPAQSTPNPPVIPANVPAFENGDAGTKPRRLERNRETGEPCPDHADIDVEVERQPRALVQRRAVRSVGLALGSPTHDVFLRTLRILVTLS